MRECSVLVADQVMAIPSLLGAYHIAGKGKT